MPPLQLVLDIAWRGLLIPFVVTTAIAYVCVRFLGKAGETAGGLLALTLGFLAGNFFLEAIEFRLDSERPLSVVEFGRAAWMTVTGIIPAEQTVPSSRYWLPWVSLLVALVGLLFKIPKMPVVVAWALRIALVVVVSRLIAGPVLRGEVVWLWPVLACVLLVNWFVLDVLGRESTSRWLPSGMVWISFASATVLIHAHTARFTDIATILVGCWAALAIMEWRLPGTQLRTSALPTAAILLPGMMLIAQQTTYSEVPLASFVLMGIVPAALAPLLFIRGYRKSMPSYLYAAWALILIPTFLAMMLAARAETLSFE